MQPIDNAALRMIDANANRAVEGLRTLEDLARFVLDDANLCGCLKLLRHELASIVAKHFEPQRFAVRDVSGDVGTAISTEHEIQRESLQEIASAAAERVQQSLRCLEECVKLASVNDGQIFEKLRYRAYQLNAKLRLKLNRDREFLQRAKLYVLVDCELALRTFSNRIKAIAEAGVDLIQIRSKSADALVILQYADAAMQNIDNSKTRLIVNDRVDCTCVTKAAGVHLGQTDISVLHARKLLPTSTWIGVSTHNVQQLEIAIQTGADYVGCGPTFVSKTKAFAGFAGLLYLCEIAQQTTIPAFAIGGITLDNLTEVLATGVTRIAVADAIWNASDPALAARQFAEALG